MKDGKRKEAVEKVLGESRYEEDQEIKKKAERLGDAAGEIKG